MKAARRVQPHPFVPDGIADFKGNERCEQCSLPKFRRDAHQMPEVSAEVSDAEARRLGERDGGN